MAFYFYIIDGEIVANTLVAKLKLLRRHLLNRKNNGAIIIITPMCNPYEKVNKTDSLDFVSSLLQSLPYLKHLSSL